MRPIELLSHLRTLDINVWADGDRLRFNAPKDALTTELRDQLIAHKAEILAFLRKGAAGRITPPPILAAPRTGPPPLSFAQQRLWFLNQLSPGLPGYNIPTAVRLSGALDVGALQHSLDAIIGRHEALRTTFTTIDGEPVQMIVETARLPLEEIDLRRLPPAQRETTARHEAFEEAQRPFDLERGPLVRAILLRLDETEYLALFTMHHIIADGWSMGVLIRELAAFYTAYTGDHVNEQQPVLPPLPVQYADFAIWQRGWLHGDVLAQQLAYWRQQLAGELPPLDLPIARPRPAVQTFAGATHSFAVAPKVSAALYQLSSRAGVTLFMTLLAAWQILLHRYSGLDDILVGSPIANRTRSEIETLIGFFVNTLVLRGDLAGNPTVQELLQRIREMTLAAYAHQDVPFERLVEELRPERDLSRTPLFQVMFLLQNAATEPVELPGLTMRPEESHAATAKFDLLLAVAESSDGLTGELEYNTDLFAHAAIERLIAHFQILLQGMVAEHDPRIDDLPLLSATEREQLLYGWNDTAAELTTSCVHQLFEQQAARSPAAIAVEFPSAAGALQLSYAELNERANQLAHRLQELGVGPDVRVALCMERSPELVLGVLAVLKAGGAYVPLDPTYPAERLAWMLDDSGCPILLTRHAPGGPNGVSATIGAQHSRRQIDLIADWPTIQVEPTTPPVSRVTSANLAYVIYTSGSTGRPKGVAMPHAALANLLRWQLRSFTIAHPARTLQFSSPSFDVSFQEIFSTWCSGGTLVLIADELRRDPAALVRFLNDHAIERLFLPFVALQQLAEVVAAQGSAPTALREIITAGEQLRITQPIARWLSDTTSILHNHYGPSESHVVTAHTLQGAPDQWPTLPPIGRPIANTQIFLLDGHMQPVPIGVPGELYIGGANLARGYLDQPTLTAEKFIPNPFLKNESLRFVPHPSSFRLYKTGDLARYLPDGSIEFLGRADTQVKVRGYRIEPGEIEAVLAQHPAVRETVVVARTDTSGSAQLIAYIIPHNAAATATEQDQQAHGSTLITELRGFLQQRLPSYMLPAMFVRLETWPLTPSGKVDRRRLPAPDASRIERQHTYVAPRDTLELGLAQIWEELLGVPSVGVHDNFFDLGGHSLLVVRLMSRIQQQFGQNVPVSVLFQGATIEHLAQTLRQRHNRPTYTPLVGLQPGGSQRPFFCVHPAAGNVLCYIDLAQRLGSAQPFYGLQAAGLDAEQPPRSTIEEMADAYIAALRVVQPEGPYLLGGWSFGGLVAFEMARQLQAQGQVVALLALIDSHAPVVDSAPAGDGVTLLAGFALDLARRFGKEPPVTLDDLRRIDADRRVLFVLEQARTAGVLPPDIDEQQIQRALAVFAANMQAMQRYRPQRYAGRVTLLRASQQPTQEALEPALGWADLATEGVTVHTIPGDHYSIVTPPHVQTLAELLRTEIDAANELALC